MISVDYVESWKLRLRSRIFTQFQGKPTIEAVSDAIAAEWQEWEDAAQALFSLLSIDDSVGLQLQVIGRLVGQPYTGEDDPTYRLRLKARIAANRSSGDPEDLYTVFNACFGLAGQGNAAIVPYPPAPAQFVFRVLGLTLTPTAAAVLYALLVEAKVAGSRLLLEWRSVPSPIAFTCCDANAPAVQSTLLGFTDGPLAPPEIEEPVVADGGSLPAGTYAYRVTALTASGETTPSFEITPTIPTPFHSAPQTIEVAWVAEPYATGYRVYGRKPGAERLLAQLGADATSWIEDGTAVGTSLMPTQDTTYTDGGALGGALSSQ